MNDLAPITSVDAYRASDHSKLQDMLNVREIMTPRDRFLCAIQGETVAEAFERVPDIYDALPVVEGDDRRDISAAIVGIIDRRHLRGADMSDQVADHIDDNAVCPIRADLPLLSFVRSLREERLTLVTDAASEEVIGLVTNYDVARLPVRIALFAALIDLEEDVGGLITRFGGSPDSWHRLLRPNANELRKQLADGLRRSQSRADQGDPILAVGFGVKLALLEGLQKPARLQGQLPRLSDIRRVRNAIAHGKPFKDLLEVPQAARDIEALREYTTRQVRRAG